MTDRQIWRKHVTLHSLTLFRCHGWWMDSKLPPLTSKWEQRATLTDYISHKPLLRMLAGLLLWPKIHLEKQLVLPGWKLSNQWFLRNCLGSIRSLSQCTLIRLFLDTILRRKKLYMHLGFCQKCLISITEIKWISMIAWFNKKNSFASFWKGFFLNKWQTFNADDDIYLLCEGVKSRNTEQLIVWHLTHYYLFNCLLSILYFVELNLQPSEILGMVSKFMLLLLMLVKAVK